MSLLLLLVSSGAPPPEPPPVIVGSGGRSIRFAPGVLKSPEEAAPLIRRTGAVLGVMAAVGAVVGTRASTGTISGSVASTGCTGSGVKVSSGSVSAVTSMSRHAIHGAAVSMRSHDDIRRMREDAELLLLV